MLWIDRFSGGWTALAATLTVLLSLAAAGHALLYKRDSRSAVLWVGFIWFVPLVGALLYFVFGINRIRRRAILLRGSMQRYRSETCGAEYPGSELAGYLPANAHHLAAVAEVVDKVVSRHLVAGNRIVPLVNGDMAYPAMLEAIEGARESVALSTYIFDRDESGLSFARALGKAVRRGVEVRVLIDATGTRYSWPPILRALRDEGVPHARFLRTFPPWQLLSLNLRNHRKLLVVDGRVGFTGGMNIRVGHHLSQNPSHPVQDLHFRVEGPVVAHLQEAFADDWFFTRREALRGPAWFPPLESAGTVIARGIADGPDEGYEKLRWTLLGAIAAARESISILTPYFLPEPAIVSALNVAAMRGVAVHIVLPAKGNLPVAQWASTAHLWQVLIHGCRIWLTPPPFDHSKLFIVDGCWSSVGSTNWDPRSLRLNFEFNLECYDGELAGVLGALFERKRAGGREITLQEINARTIPVRLRDGAARMLTPFL
jgi:cardiolipin synthase